MKIIKGSLFILHLFVAIFAFLGGWAAISQPLDPFGISTDMLANSPFKTFLIPGLLLFTVIGFGQLLAAAFILFRSRYQAYVSFFTGGVLLISAADTFPASSLALLVFVPTNLVYLVKLQRQIPHNC